MLLVHFLTNLTNVDPAGSVIKNPCANGGDASSIPGSGRYPREGNGNPLKYSYLRNLKDRGAWWTVVHGVTKELDMTYHVNNNNR